MTRDMVEQAMAPLEQQGEAVTLRKILQITGGSFRDVVPLVRQIRGPCPGVEAQAVREGDTVVISLEGFFLGPPVPGAKSRPPPLRVEGWYRALVGMRPGETRQVLAQYPSTYPVSQVAGKQIIFHVTVHEIHTGRGQGGQQETQEREHE